jgi:hypothetical protein
VRADFTLEGSIRCTAVTRVPYAGDAPLIPMANPGCAVVNAPAILTIRSGFRRYCGRTSYVSGSAEVYIVNEVEPVGADRNSKLKKPKAIWLPLSIDVPRVRPFSYTTHVSSMMVGVPSKLTNSSTLPEQECSL